MDRKTKNHIKKVIPLLVEYARKKGLTEEDVIELVRNGVYKSNHPKETE